MRLGIDIGSTTLKYVLLNDDGEIICKNYSRHFSKINEKLHETLENVSEYCSQEECIACTISGSAGMGIAEKTGISFVQEVYATRLAVNTLVPGTDVVIELGGEDAKILYLTDGLEVRMNGSCAGGTGAFIDQMATLLNISPAELNELASKAEKNYTIASRCGVFAKSDIQPLLNQGAQKNDIAMSILYAVVNQTVAGLAQGRKIEGNVLYLGGPLTYFSELRKCFDKVLKSEGVCPENSLYFVSYGAAISNGNEEKTLAQIIKAVETEHNDEEYRSCLPLFNNEQEYNDFSARHAKAKVGTAALTDGMNAYIGIDSGSTTLKAVVIDEDENVVYSEYSSNKGAPVEMLKGFLENVYSKCPNINILGSAATGYGEDMILNAFNVDHGIVETIAHYTAASKFMPDVDFIIDIGGQDIKCFKIRNGTIDNIFLNEACSSGCGSFLQTFAETLGYSVADFTKEGLYADKPVDLGSRCTVFMNSSVKQAQKEGASVANISAGLSISIVKNALYKVIRTASADELGKNIVVQGGTFLNDAVLRAFEKEIGRDVIRPDLAGLMGAYGAALYAKRQSDGKSGTLTAEQLKSFKHETSALTCNGCTNHCKLTINSFDSGRKFIAGNKCDKPTGKSKGTKKLNIFAYKRSLLDSYKPVPGHRGKIGIPMALNMYEMLPFWHPFFTSLGFEVVSDIRSNRKLYFKGQETIPSDTVCYPAKLVHGHIDELVERGIKNIFYPCMSYNMNEGKGDNFYNCPVVAYYPEVINANSPKLRNVNFIYDYIGPHDRKAFEKKFYKTMLSYFPDIKKGEFLEAVDKAYTGYNEYLEKIRKKGEEIRIEAEKEHIPIIVLCGRPYHLDQEISHGIDELVCDCGAAVISEDSICHLVDKFKVNVLNQWTYHARLYSAAAYITDKPNMNLVQMVSFGCGVDAITTDEVRSILESHGKIYTQIKIDEVTNLGAVRIRLRSLFSALEMQKKSQKEQI